MIQEKLNERPHQQCSFLWYKGTVKDLLQIYYKSGTETMRCGTSDSETVKFIEFHELY